MLRRVVMLVILGIALAPTGCQTCPGSRCPAPADILGPCLVDHTCTIDGMPTADCTPGYCDVALDLQPGDVLRVPLDWGAIGASNTGLSIEAPEAPGFTAATVLFDDAPAQGCTVTPLLVQCSPVPSSVQSVSFSYSGDLYGRGIGITMSDLTCLAEYPPPDCPE